MFVSQGPRARVSLNLGKWGSVLKGGVWVIGVQFLGSRF